MSTPQQVAGAAQDAAGQTAGTAKDEAAQVGGAVSSAASDVVGTTKQQAGAVADEAVSQVRQLTSQARSQAAEQAGNATQKISESIRALAQELREMSTAGSTSGPVSELAGQAATRSEQLADYLDQNGPGGLVTELRGFAARRPGGFLLGALLAGVATGRVVKGASAASSQQSLPGSRAGLSTGRPVTTGRSTTDYAATTPASSGYAPPLSASDYPSSAGYRGTTDYAGTTDHPSTTAYPTDRVDDLTVSPPASVGDYSTRDLDLVDGDAARSNLEPGAGLR